MNKKELDNLHTRRCTMQRTPVNNGRGLEDRVIVCFSLYDGELISLLNALKSSDSEVTKDVLSFLNNAYSNMGNKL